MPIELARAVRPVAPQGGRPRIARELAAVLVLKALALFVIWQAFFADAPRDKRGADAVGERIVPTLVRNSAPADQHARP